MRAQTQNRDESAIALEALVWTLSEPDRAARLLALTGLTPQSLRAAAGEPSLQAAVLGFLESHEPDLVACADALALAPATLVAARARLECR